MALRQPLLARPTAGPRVQHGRTIGKLASSTNLREDSAQNHGNRYEGQNVKEHMDRRMGLWRRWTNELMGAFNAAWLAVAAAATLGVLGLTHIPREDIPAALDFGRLDKLEHIGAYGTVTALYLLALRRRPDGSAAVRSDSKRKRWEVRGWLSLAILIAVGLAILGAVDELTQPYMHRTCDIMDWVGDATGITLAFAIFLVRRAIVGY